MSWELAVAEPDLKQTGGTDRTHRESILFPSSSGMGSLGTAGGLARPGVLALNPRMPRATESRSLNVVC